MSWFDRTVYTTFSDGMAYKKQEGEIGLEIEVEGLNLPQGNMQYHWNGHMDNSLRPVEGHHPQEYSLKKPVSREELSKVLEYLTKKLEANKAEPRLHQRTSVHVHINVQNLTLKQVFTYLTLYYIFEEVLTEYAGSRIRQGNLFCLKATDAEYVIKALSDSIKNKNPGHINDMERLKYHACNISAMSTFGSLEFRAHRGCVDPVLIERWVKILLKVKDASNNYLNPQEVVQAFSAAGVYAFSKSVFGEYYDLLNLSLYRQKLWDGLRLVQDLAYAISDWKSIPDEPLKKKKTKEDEFFADFEEQWEDYIPPPQPQPAIRRGRINQGQQEQVQVQVPGWVFQNNQNNFDQNIQPPPGGVVIGNNCYYPIGYEGRPEIAHRTWVMNHQNRGIYWRNGQRCWNENSGTWEEV